MLIMPTPKTKTLFGNQSVLGTGNIDLYRHSVAFYGGSFKGKELDAHAVFIPSNNLQCDSLTDLKTILGDTFYICVSGDVLDNLTSTRYPLLECNYSQGIRTTNSDFDFPWAAITSIYDTVTTI